MMKTKRFLPLILLAILAAFPLLAPLIGFDYYIGFVRRALIFALAAASLNFILGYGGLAALGHAGFLGVGAYTMVALADTGVESAWLMWGGAMLVAALASVLIGLVALRTRGVYFLMITLAFAQMLYYIAVSLRVYGGDDGYSLAVRPSLGLGLDSMNESTLYWVILGLFAVAMWLLNRATASRFGHALMGIRDNETRMQAMGYPVFGLRLFAFSLAGAIVGLAGALLTTQNSFISPSAMHWTQSATLIVMVVIGGVGRRWGGPVGAVAWIFLTEVFKSYTDYWQLPMGVLVILTVFLAPRGLSGIFDCRADSPLEGGAA